MKLTFIIILVSLTAESRNLKNLFGHLADVLSEYLQTSAMFMKGLKLTK